ncbi:DNA primase [Pseudochelatococcus lubricantis]|uniref:DNA primase n=1 Tax=Pseudochelatococcus lubricantis TaxID=1538102 RepID=A0ABX0UZ46_9HYPH|nr:DNA primase [Pseudochelatococcus lubricantis]NIJ58207.1 DNA primase [Pseudochelatococcus lubricantis]
MRYPPSLLDEIRARLPVSAVVGRKVRLVKAGREWKGLSPFNAEKTPSFFVNDQKGFYHCFSSGKHGDIFAFLMETEGMPFPEAVERLAAEAGVPLPASTPEMTREEERRNDLYDVVERAAAFFEETLNANAGREARAYLERRGIGARTRRAFRLGYAPGDRFALRDHLAASGVSREAMIEAGLLIAHEDTAVPYDRFRDRVMFPIHDRRGRVIAFGGRAMSADVQAKYLNSSETPLFHKGRVLYNLHNARKAANDSGAVIAVEGYVDVIAMSMAGFGHTVAPLGTALTGDQVTLLWRMADEPILCFDGDAAGRRAAFRAIDTALPLLAPGKSLRFALLPEGQDPDDLVRAGGAEAIATVLRQARPLADMLWMRERELGPLDTPERRAALERRVSDVVATIADETIRRHYRADMLNRLRGLLPSPDRGDSRPRAGAGFGGPRNGPAVPGGWRPGAPGRSNPQGGAFAGATAPRASPALARHPMFAPVRNESPREALIVLGLLAHTSLLDTFAEDIAALDFSGPLSRRLRARLVDVVASGGADPRAVRERIEAAGLAETVAGLVRIVVPGDRWILAPDSAIDDVSTALRQAVTLQRRARTLHTELRAAAHALAEDDSEANLAWLLDIQVQVTSLEGAEADGDPLNTGAAQDDPSS